MCFAFSRGLLCCEVHAVAVVPLVLSCLHVGRFRFVACTIAQNLQFVVTTITQRQLLQAFRTHNQVLHRKVADMKRRETMEPVFIEVDVLFCSGDAAAKTQQRSKSQTRSRSRSAERTAQRNNNSKVSPRGQPAWVVRKSSQHPSGLFSSASGNNLLGDDADLQQVMNYDLVHDSLGLGLRTDGTKVSIAFAPPPKGTFERGLTLLRDDLQHEYTGPNAGRVPSAGATVGDARYDHDELNALFHSSPDVGSEYTGSSDDEEAAFDEGFVHGNTKKSNGKQPHAHKQMSIGATRAMYVADRMMRQSSARSLFTQLQQQQAADARRGRSASRGRSRPGATPSKGSKGRSSSPMSARREIQRHQSSDMEFLRNMTMKQRGLPVDDKAVAHGLEEGTAVDPVKLEAVFESANSTKARSALKLFHQLKIQMKKNELIRQGKLKSREERPADSKRGLRFDYGPKTTRRQVEVRTYPETLARMLCTGVSCAKACAYSVSEGPLVREGRAI